MDFSLLLNNITSWRDGHVMNDIVFNVAQAKALKRFSLILKSFTRMAIATISMKMKLGLSALKPIFMRSDSLPFMSSGQLKILPRKSVICSPSATMYVAQKMPIRILPLLRWMN